MSGQRYRPLWPCGLLRPCKVCSPAPQVGLEAKALTHPCILAGGRVRSQTQLCMVQAGLLWGSAPLVADSDGRYGDWVFLEDEDDSASGLWVESGPDGCVSPLPSLGWGPLWGREGNPSTAASGVEHFTVVCLWVEASGVSGTGGIGGAPEATYWKQMDSS